jgi:hypothetical protein
MESRLIAECTAQKRRTGILRRAGTGSAGLEADHRSQAFDGLLLDCLPSHIIGEHAGK